MSQLRRRRARRRSQVPAAAATASTASATHPAVDIDSSSAVSPASLAAGDGDDEMDGAGDVDEGTGTAITVEVRTVVGCDVGSGSRVLEVAGAGSVVSGDCVSDRDGLGSDSVCSGTSADRVGLGSVRVGDGNSACVCSGASADRVGFGNARVGDSEAVADGRSPVACPSVPPHADRRPSARTHRMALRAARGGMRNLQPPGSGRPRCRRLGASTSSRRSDAATR
jgi:hypothetical protein